MYGIICGLGLILVAMLLIWLGVHRRRLAYADYGKDNQKYSATTAMKVINVDKSIEEQWEDREDGNRELVPVTFYQHTYEYIVNGKTYNYTGERCNSGKSLNTQVNGYYDPANPENITEYKPRKPIFTGIICFAGAVVLLFYAIELIRNNLFWIL